jgi:hypothetical protein
MAKRKPARHPRRTADEISTTPAAKAVREAIRHIGGTVRAAEIVGRSDQAVQKWTEYPESMSATITRQLAAACGYRVSVSAMRPDIFGGLTLKELGYVPASYPEARNG